MFFLVFWDVHGLLLTDDVREMIFTHGNTGVWLKTVREESSIVCAGTVGILTCLLHGAESFLRS